MSGNTNISLQAKLWRKFTGNPGEFSMENRAFNYICVISFVLLLYYCLFSLLLHQLLIAGVIAVLIVVLAFLYYYSRYKKKFEIGIIVYAFCSYTALIFNYYVNAGINGPTVCLLFVIFQVFIAIGKPRQYIAWVSLHVGIIASLFYTEYMHPEWVPDTYLERKDRFIDIAANFVAAIIFSLAITSYLRKYLNRKRLLAEQSTKALMEINKQILDKNKELEKVNQEKNKLFSIVSHDLKSPLDSIMGYLELLSGNALAPDEKTMIEQELLDQTKYTSDMLSNLLSWAKTQMQGVNVRVTAVVLKDIVDNAAKSKISVAAKKQIKLTYSINPGLEAIADADMLHIVLRNLVNNAIKFTNPGGEIIIRAIRNGKEVLISVQDNGIGIPKEKQGGIFSLKTESTFGTNNEKGIGLGLMLCKEFITYQRGNIWFESKQDSGTTFFITLPVALR